MPRYSLTDMLREERRATEARQLFAEVVDSPNLEWPLQLSALMGMADADMGQGNLTESIDGWKKALVIARDRADKLILAEEAWSRALKIQRGVFGHLNRLEFLLARPAGFGPFNISMRHSAQVVADIPGQH